MPQQAWNAIADRNLDSGHQRVGAIGFVSAEHEQVQR